MAKDTPGGPIVFFAQPAFDLSELVLEQLKAMAPKEMEPPVVGPKVQTPAQSSTRSAKTVKKNKPVPPSFLFYLVSKEGGIVVFISL